MHATETKHGLNPLFLAEYSDLFLNFDRGLAFLTFLYGCYRASDFPLKTLTPIAVQLAVGTIALRLGELTSNLWLYNFLHTIWHFAAFDALRQVL